MESQDNIEFPETFLRLQLGAILFREHRGCQSSALPLFLEADSKHHKAALHAHYENLETDAMNRSYYAPCRL